MKRAQELVNVNRKELGDAREERDQLRKRLVEAQRHVRDTKKSLDRAEQRLAQSEQAEKMSRREAARAKTQRRQAETLLGKATWAE
jgi:predicted  nucleic acid-binding Zn-ribbon protein